MSTAGAPRGSLEQAQAQWLARDTIAWKIKNSPGYTYQLYFAPNGGLRLNPTGLTGGEALALKYSLGGLSSRLTLQYPHLTGYGGLQLAAGDLEKIPHILKGQVAVAAFNEVGNLIDATGVQIPGVLDDLYDYAGALGVEYMGDTPILHVWAPTAQAVALLLFEDAETPIPAKYQMTLDPATGVWHVAGTAAWTWQYYLYEVQVYAPSTQQVETNRVTDPYSFSLALNSLRSQIVNLADPTLKPTGWDDLVKPPLAAPEDIVLYELHIRDFSRHDATVPENLRGTYKAFTVLDSNGMQHLTALAKAGLTHIHLLPTFDIASVDEDKTTWQTVDEAELSRLPPDSDAQAQAVRNVAGRDGFNWGYDPYHHSVPEGAYSTKPNGPARILEFRQLVQALNGAGLRVVLDVVYNHTYHSGQNPTSVLDKIVPGYYHRLDAAGNIETSTCCQNTASEHKMMEKLLVDSVVVWATAYKVDGFRFDLMAHHLLRNLTHVRATLDTLTPATAGVEGKAVYVYGEAWNFGELAHNARGPNASQLNIGGTGIGVFNDRLRDAVRGGGPFDDPRRQGFATGLLDAPNACEPRDVDERRAVLLQYMDWLRVSLAGNLQDYAFINAAGQLTPSSKINYNGQPAGYALDPQENIAYVSSHDNQTLFDTIQVKAAITETIADRVRMNNLALSLVMFAQGVPFFHAGDDLLRSKSLDPNSYNSGDWFNRIDWTYQTNNWGVGLPPECRNQWEIYRPLLANPNLVAQPKDIALARDVFRELLQIRHSSPLFRLRTATEVQQRLTFYNVGPEQIPGLIVMSLDDRVGADLDPAVALLVVLFNGNKDQVPFTQAAFQGLALELHPIQQTSVDSVVKTAIFEPLAGTFRIPGRTTAVFSLRQTAPAEPIPTATP